MADLVIGGLSIYAYITLFTVLTVFALMIFTKLPADMIFGGSIVFLYITGVLDTKEALGGFSNSSVVTVGVLYIVVCGLVRTGVLQWIARHLLGSPKGYKRAIVRLMLPVAALSSFLSNTAVVAMFIQIVTTWSKRLKIAPSKLLIPLSYASGMGGVCTLIGTPPNLIVSGLYQQDAGVAMNLFTTLPIGLICLGVGILSMLAMNKLLPERKSPDDALSKTEDFTVEFLVPTECDCVGQTLAEASLYDVKGGRILEIIRFDKETISPVDPDEFIFGGDRLVYSGSIQELLLLEKERGFTNSTKHEFTADITKNNELKRGFVTFGSSLIGKRISETAIESDNGFVVVAIAREGCRIKESPREIILRAGDSLLLSCAPSFLKNTDSVKNDLSISNPEMVIKTGTKTIVSSLIMIAMLMLSAFKVISLLQSCFLAAAAMLISKCCTVDEARRSIDWKILMIFAGSVCLGTAIQKTGLASFAADGVLSICGTNPYIALAALYFITTFLTEFVSNTATAAIFYPIAYSTATSLGVSPMPFLIVLMVAASSSFATPIGSPTHMMVYGPGGYRFTDFLKVGIMMNLIMMATAMLFVPLIWPF